ncbi:MAG: hypothetical protein M1554_03285 [Patescibacteria group bacterium]|jgi:hypothetical protein|nr:hypothetical protein [Patescibacteria group bacterium]
MDIENKHVINPRKFLKREKGKFNRFNKSLAVLITRGVGSMWSAYLFAILSLMSLPAILVLISPSLKPDFPKWIIDASLITLIAWISQNFLQLVLLPVIMVGQNVIQDHQAAKAQADHKTLTYLANLQEEQMNELKSLSQKLNSIIQNIQK